MEAQKLDLIKDILSKEQRLEAKLKKNPNLAPEISPQLNELYRKRVQLEREEWGCGVQRNLWNVLKNVLLEQAHLEQMLNDGISDSQKADIQRLLDITRNKRDVLVQNIEQTRDTSVSCPILPKGESPSAIASFVRDRCDQYLKTKHKTSKKQDNEKNKNKIKRREIIRLLASDMF